MPSIVRYVDISPWSTWTLFKNPDGSEEKKLVLSSVSRALWFNNPSLVKKLIDYSAAAAKDLVFAEDAQVKAHSFVAFETTLGDLFTILLRRSNFSNR